MSKKYRYRSPIVFTYFKYGFSLYLQKPIIRIEDGSISIFLTMFDD